MTVPPSARGRITRGLEYCAEPADVDAATELKPGWRSWTGVQVSHVVLPSFTASDVRVPDWMLLSVVAVPMAYLMFRRYRATRPGRCPGCGYDLRATPRRCPECGWSAVPVAG